MTSSLSDFGRKEYDLAEFEMPLMTSDDLC